MKLYATVQSERATKGLSKGRETNKTMEITNENIVQTVYTCQICKHKFISYKTVRGSMLIDDGEKINLRGNICKTCADKINEFVLTIQK